MWHLWAACFISIPSQALCRLFTRIWSVLMFNWCACCSRASLQIFKCLPRRHISLSYHKACPLGFNLFAWEASSVVIHDAPSKIEAIGHCIRSQENLHPFHSIPLPSVATGINLFHRLSKASSSSATKLRTQITCGSHGWRSCRRCIGLARC